MSHNPRGKNEEAALATHVIQGIRKHYPGGSQQLPLAGASLTVDEVAATLQSLVDNRQATVTAQATAATRVDVEDAQRPAQLAILRALVALVRASYGNSPDTLGDFGIPTHKNRTPMTAEDKAVAVARRAATRAARHTQGPVQKASIHGNVHATLVVTPASPAPSPSGASPAAVTGAAPAATRS